MTLRTKDGWLVTDIYEEPSGWWVAIGQHPVTGEKYELGHAQGEVELRHLLEAVTVDPLRAKS